MNANKQELNNDESQANVAQSAWRYCYIKSSGGGNNGQKSTQKENKMGKEDQPTTETEKNDTLMNDHQTDIYSLD